MYFSPKKHILSNTLMAVALIRLLCAGVSAGIRFLVRRGGVLPDMADETLWNMQSACSAAAILFSAVVFAHALRTVGRSLALIPEEDRQEMALLQQEVFGKGNAALTADAIRKLLRIWFVILVGAQLMYDFSSEIYRRFALYLSDVVNAGGTAYVALYNLTHGFKYQGMMIALLLGGMMTGIFLGDWLMRIAVLLIAAVFMVSTAGLEMVTVSIMGQEIGIVLSSGIFHLLETVGLVILAFYMRIRYHGV